MARKVFHHFSLALRLAWMYNTPTQAKLMAWHHHNYSQNGLIQHPKNLHQWNFVEALGQILPRASYCTIGISNEWGEPIWSPKVKLVHMASGYVEL